MKHPLWRNAVAGDGRRYVVVPNADDPRLVLPTRPKRAALAVLSALRDGSTANARVRTSVLRMAVISGARTVRLPDPRLFEVLAAELGGGADDFVFGVHLGPPRANRKPVIAVADHDGRLVGFAKCGVDELTDALVRHEAAALPGLVGLSDVNAPTLLASGDHDGHAYVVQAPVPTTSGAADPQAVVKAQVEVSGLGASDLNVSACIDRIASQWRARQETSTNQFTADFAQLADAWCREASAADLRWGSWHGDWRRTNMAVTEGRCSVWDWERFASGVPVGYDALHLYLTTQVSSVTDLSTLPGDLRDHAARLLRPFGLVDRADIDLVTTGYLLELAGRYLDDDQAATGARLGAVGQWLLPALQLRTSAPSIKPGGNHS